MQDFSININILIAKNEKKLVKKDAKVKIEGKFSELRMNLNSKVYQKLLKISDIFENKEDRNSQIEN